MSHLEKLLKCLNNFENWIYCGDDQSKSGLEYFVSKTGRSKFPGHRISCLCGHHITRQYYIMNKFTKDVKTIGNICINFFLPKENRRKTCSKCGEAHRNRTDDLCKKCRPKKLSGNECSTDECGNRHRNRKYPYCNTCGKTACKECLKEIWKFDANIFKCIFCYKEIEYYCETHHFYNVKFTICPDENCQSQKHRIKEEFYFYVPYDDKEEAKELGSRWDNNFRKWYAPNNDVRLLMKNTWKVFRIRSW